MESHSFFLMFLLLIGIVATTSAHGQGTRVGFYSATCPKAEKIVKSTVTKHFKSNPRIAPGILRMHFHDCFVRGCDGSVLIEGANTEKTAFQNNRIPGYNVIDDAKARLEAACPGVVSCADILALAARDSVVLTKGFSWKVPTGRRDGRVSIASDAANLPGAREPMASQLQKFSTLGLNTQDLVALVGGHTIGTTSCAVFRNRLFNFTTPTGADPTIDPSFVPTLRAMCPQQGGDPSLRIDIDNGSGLRFDTNFFANVRKGRGIIESDQMLWTDPATRTFVEQFLGGTGRGPTKTLNFKVEFGKSMVKMGNIGIKTGSDGEIRRICTAIN